MTKKVMIKSVKRLKEKLINNDKLFVLVKCIKNFRSPELCQLLRAYYQREYKGCVYLLEHPGTVMPQETIYDMSVGELNKSYTGFCAVMHCLLYGLKIADEYNLLPRVVWGEGSPYYEPEFKGTANNAFEYYFEPLSVASNYSCSDFKNLVRYKTKHILKYQNMLTDSYLANENNIGVLAESFKKHIHLNEKTKKLIFDDVEKMLKKDEKVLGVHARGGDFKLEQKNHPHSVSSEEYLKKAQKEFMSGDYDKIFIATDDKNILELFVSNFGNKLVYYSDVPRVSGIKGIHVKESSRDMHHYRLGLELLRDVYTLVSCNSFICGLSHVSFMVRYVKESLGEQFNKVIILDEGINR